MRIEEIKKEKKQLANDKSLHYNEFRSKMKLLNKELNSLTGQSSIEGEEEEGYGIHAKGIYASGLQHLKKKKDVRHHIKRVKAKHEKLMKLLNNDLKTIHKIHSKASGLHASGIGAGFFSSLGNIFKNIIGKVVGIGKTILSKPENIVKTLNVGKEIYDSGKQTIKDIKNKRPLGIITSDILHTGVKTLTGLKQIKNMKKNEVVNEAQNEIPNEVQNEVEGSVRGRGKGRGVKKIGVMKPLKMHM
jgi:hypothetical protein